MLIIATGVLMLIYVITYGKHSTGCIYTYLHLHRYSSATRSSFSMGTIPFSSSLRESEAPVPMEGHCRILLYDACDVFQYLHQFAYQLSDHYSAGRQYP